MKVTIVQRILPHYRSSFAQQLHEQLAMRGIQLELVYGQELPGTVPRTTPLQKPWAHQIDNRYLTVGGTELVWQPCLSKLRDSDLIIVEQSNRLLLNYWLQLRRTVSRPLFAFWGHGRNMQSRNPQGLRERLKSSLARHVDWWFAYTELSRDTVLRSGFPDERVTVVNNAVDDEELRRGMHACGGIEPLEMARTLGCKGGNVALFCGGLNREKRIDFVLSAAQRVRALVPDFELLIVGDGPERARVEEARQRLPWIHYAGAQMGEARARYFHAAKLLLMPGAIGLVAVDSFIGRCPLFTTELAYHGPEIAYLRSGYNGCMTADDVDSYARSVAQHLQQPRTLDGLKAGCDESARKYSLSAMVTHFAGGVERCLKESTRGARADAGPARP
jgi:glycosyltransferase involved in cell wall biosynthesis